MYLDGLDKLVRGFRQARRLSQASFAAEAGIAKRTVASVESGRHPDVQTLEALGRALGLPTLYDLADALERANGRTPPTRASGAALAPLADASALAELPERIAGVMREAFRAAGIIQTSKTDEKGPR